MSIAEYNRICPVCGKEFIAERKDNIYCSPKCRDKQYYERNKKVVYYNRTCPVCGKEFIAERKDKIYCTRKCKSKQYYKDHKDEKAEYDKQYYKDHKDEKVEYNKQYRKDHKDEIAQYNKKYYKDHRDEKIEYRNQYYENKLKKLIQEYSEFKNIPAEDLEWVKKVPASDRILETEFEYIKFGTAKSGFERHHIIPYHTCKHYRNSHERYSDEWYYWNNLACDFKNNGVDLPIEVHKILHSKLADNGFNKQSIIPLERFEEYKILTFRLIDEISRELS